MGTTSTSSRSGFPAAGKQSGGEASQLGCYKLAQPAVRGVVAARRAYPGARLACTGTRSRRWHQRMVLPVPANKALMAARGDGWIKCRRR